MNSMARRMFELVEPIGVIPYSADEPNEADVRPGVHQLLDTYSPDGRRPWARPSRSGGRALLQPRSGRGARHIPKVWRTTTPERRSPLVRWAARMRCGGSSAIASTLPRSPAPPNC